MHDTISQSDPPVEKDSPSLIEDFRRLTDEAKTYAQAELAYQKSRAAYVSSEARWVAFLAVVALALMFFAIMACVVGTVIALGPLIGLWGSMLAVTMSLMIAAVAALLSVRSRLRRVARLVSNANEEQSS